MHQMTGCAIVLVFWQDNSSVRSRHGGATVDFELLERTRALGAALGMGMGWGDVGSRMGYELLLEGIQDHYCLVPAILVIIPVVFQKTHIICPHTMQPPNWDGSTELVQ